VVLWALIWVNLIGFFVPYPGAASRAICVIGVILFSLFILYDTSMIMNRLGTDEWVIASVDLYLDVLNLFLYLLRLLGAGKK
jgi:FtsH-binding integral membrane protein